MDFTPEELATEEWRPCLPDREVSNLGRYRVTRDGRWGLPGAVHLGSLNTRGYRIVNTRGQNYLVHVLVLTAFVGPRPDGLEGCHNNGVRTDNRLANLRWDTRAANIEDAQRHGTMPAKLVPYLHLLGTVRDTDIARASGASRQAVHIARKARGIARFSPGAV